MLINAVAPFAGAWIEILKNVENAVKEIVAPFAGAWIEITSQFYSEEQDRVAPFAGAWIEIGHYGGMRRPSGSLPSRERGLKCFKVSPFEITHIVAPFAGAWIEILRGQRCVDIGTSLPSRERGLKLSFPCSRGRTVYCRSLRGSVD